MLQLSGLGLTIAIQDTGILPHGLLVAAAAGMESAAAVIPCVSFTLSTAFHRWQTYPSRQTMSPLSLATHWLKSRKELMPNPDPPVFGWHQAETCMKFGNRSLS